MEWVVSTLHTTSEHGVSNITTADGAHLGCQQSTELTPLADLSGLVLFAERRNLVSALVPSHFKRSLQPAACHVSRTRFYSIVINSSIRHRRKGWFCEGYVDQWLPASIQWRAYRGSSHYVRPAGTLKAVHFATKGMYGVHAILTTESRVLYNVTAMCVHTIVKSDYQLLHVSVRAE